MLFRVANAVGPSVQPLLTRPARGNFLYEKNPKKKLTSTSSSNSSSDEENRGIFYKKLGKFRPNTNSESGKFH